MEIRKKAGIAECECYRTVSLMSHLTKIILRVLYCSVISQLDKRFRNNRFDSSRERNQICIYFPSQMLIEKAVEVEKDLFMCS